MITNPAGGIITKGLGRPACAGMIVNYFSLTLAVRVIPPQPPTAGGGGGGAYPGPAWNVFTPAQTMNFYKPYSPEYYYKFNTRKTHIVSIRINFRGKEIERVYEVTEKQADQVVKIVGLADKARKQFEVTVKNLRKLAPSISDFRRVATKISVAIKGIRREKD